MSVPSLSTADFNEEGFFMHTRAIERLALAIQQLGGSFGDNNASQGAEPFTLNLPPGIYDPAKVEVGGDGNIARISQASSNAFTPIGDQFTSNTVASGALMPPVLSLNPDIWSYSGGYYTLAGGATALYFITLTYILRAEDPVSDNPVGSFVVRDMYNVTTGVSVPPSDPPTTGGESYTTATFSRYMIGASDFLPFFTFSGTSTVGDGKVQCNAIRLS